MRKTAVSVIVSFLLALGLATSASAHNAGPCQPSPEPGHSEYAEHHVVPVSQSGIPGAERHVPGEHQGFSTCNPSENRP